MKAKIVFLCVGVAIVAAAGGWLAAQRVAAHHAPGGAQATTSARKILYYQSAMHPWIKSDKPGRCTICGMELSAVYEGERGFDAAEGVVALGSNLIQVINVQTDEVQHRPLRRTLRFAGTIDDNDAKHRFVSAYVDGRVDKLFVNYVGAEVVEGQPLAVLYSPTLLAAEREYVALSRQAPAGAANALADEHRRLVDAATERLKRLGLEDRQIAALPAKGANDSHTEILAPVSGAVVARFVYEGQYVKEGEKLFEIADFSTMWFVFDAYERDLAWLKPGQKVEATTPALPGKVFTGTIAFIDPNLKEMTRSAKVRVELPNPLVEEDGRKRRELFHKLYADALVQVETPEVTVAPRSAVLSPGASPVLYLDKGGGVYEQRKVRLGRVGDDDYEVLEGVAIGEHIVTQGNMLIDAQAQLNASANRPAAGHDHGSTSARSSGSRRLANGQSDEARDPLPSLTDSQRRTVLEFLAMADAITAALATDSLTEFNSQASKMHTATPALASAFAKDSPWRAFIDKLEASAHLSSANDLKAARKSFHAFSEAVVELAKVLRRREAAFKSLKVFRCPMTKDAFPGAPRTAEWIQFQAPVRNPYFGAEMLDCGSEVKP